jgi:hypothetical protein
MSSIDRVDNSHSFVGSSQGLVAATLVVVAARGRGALAHTFRLADGQILTHHHSVPLRAHLSMAGVHDRGSEDGVLLYCSLSQCKQGA